MTDATQIDSAWIAANPVPVHSSGTTKNSRGRVLAIGGSRMRDYGLCVPEDAIASFTPRRTRWAVEILQQIMGAETRSTEDCSVPGVVGRCRAVSASAAVSRCRDN
jgi:hypothetical protein